MDQSLFPDFCGTGPVIVYEGEIQGNWFLNEAEEMIPYFLFSLNWDIALVTHQSIEQMFILN